MLSLHRSLDGDLTAGDALPQVYKQFEAADISFLRSSVVMTAGRPGGGKSILALDHAIKVGVPALYVSCDMSRFTLATRAAAVLTGESTAGIKELIRSAQGRDHYRAALKKADHLYLAYEKRPSAEDLEDVINAFFERWGCAPHLIVIDNLMNLLPNASDEWTGLREMSHVLDYFAAELGSCVHVLHHINIGNGVSLDKPAPMDAVKGKVVELPSLIISGSKTETEFRFCAVKNRNGREDPMSHNPFTLDLNPTTLGLSDPAPKPASYWTPPRSPEYAGLYADDMARAA